MINPAFNYKNFTQAMVKLNCLTLICFFAFLFSGFSQGTQKFQKICEQWDTFYKANPGLMDSAESEYSGYERWKYFWQDRTCLTDSLNHSSFGSINEALESYLNNYGYFHRSTNQYSNWKFVGPQGIDRSRQIVGLISAIYVDTVTDKTMNTIFIGTNSAGIWKTVDGGDNWINITDNSGYSIIGINDICGDPLNGNIIYAATGGNFMDRSHGYGIGILKTTDHGVTWSRIYPDSIWQNQSKSLNINKIIIDPSNNQRVYALADTSVIRSLDGGQSWQNIFATNACRFDTIHEHTNFLYLRDIEMKPDDPSILYVSTDHRTIYNNRQAEVWKISNVFETNINKVLSQRLDVQLPKFEFVSDTIHSIYTERYAIAVTPAEPNAIYIGCTVFPYNSTYVPRQFTIFKYENNQWDRKLKAPIDEQTEYGGCGFFKLELLVSPSNPNILYVGGNTFDKINNWHNEIHIDYDSEDKGYHPDTRYALIIKNDLQPDTTGNHDILFAGNDGGISKSTNGIHTWQNLNGNGLNITQFYGIGGTNKSINWIGGGTQDNGFFILTPQGWRKTFGGDMGDCVIDPSNPIMYPNLRAVTWCV